jgi:hypothetical protein
MEEEDEKAIKLINKEGNRSFNYLLKHKDQIKTQGGKFTYKKRFFLAYRWDKMMKKLKHWINTIYFSMFR